MFRRFAVLSRIWVLIAAVCAFCCRFPWLCLHWFFVHCWAFRHVALPCTGFHSDALILILIFDLISGFELRADVDFSSEFDFNSDYQLPIFILVSTLISQTEPIFYFDSGARIPFLILVWFKCSPDSRNTDFDLTSWALEFPNSHRTLNYCTELLDSGILEAGQCITTTTFITTVMSDGDYHHHQWRWKRGRRWQSKARQS